MNVAVVYPEVYDLARFKEKRKEFPPFGVLYLSAIIEQAGHGVQVFKVVPGDESLDLRAFDAVAFSIPSSATYGIMKKARFTSLYFGDPLLMVGGVHVNFYPEKSLADFEVDVAGIGECEETILELLATGKKRAFSAILGVAYPRNGSIIKTGPRALIGEIDKLPLPARHLFPEGDLIMTDRLAETDIRMAHVMFSRGCPFPCRFCAAAQTRMQYRSGNSARTELVHLMEQYSVGGFSVVDDNFVVNKKKVLDVCEQIKDLNLQWSALSRVDTVDENLLSNMRAAGCIEIKYGVESGSTRILNAMRKNITLDDIRNALRFAQRANINSKIFIIHGYPGENMNTTIQTLQLLKEQRSLISRVSLFRFVPLPGTYVYSHPEDFDLHGTDRDPDWRDDWERYHIYHNDRHWWGTAKDFEEVNRSYALLKDFIDNNWTSQSHQNS
jgi:radical SAM superfamily enzyme YgiQ (UPF0313 family)